MQGVGVIERAFQVAEQSESLDEIRRRLIREGYASVEAHLSGPQIKRELSRLLSRPSDVPQNPAPGDDASDGDANGESSN